MKRWTPKSMGRKGGKVKVKKGFGTLTPDQRRAAQAKSVASRKANQEAQDDETQS